MTFMDRYALIQAIHFASRWGFLSRDIYFRHFCKKRRSTQYVYWKNITSSGYFVRSKVNDRICYITPKAKNILMQESREARFHIYIEHDSLVADLILNLEQEKKLMLYWTESELKTDLMTAYSILGAERVDRFPDAVIDVIVNGKVERFAVEIERKVKSGFRYNKMVMSYSYYKNLRGVLFGCNTFSTIKAIQKSFFESQLATTEFKIGTYLYDDFEFDSLQCPVQTQQGEYTLNHFLGFKSEHQLGQPSNKKAS